MRITITRPSENPMGREEDINAGRIQLSSQTARKIIAIEHNGQTLQWNFPSRQWKAGKPGADDDVAGSDGNITFFDEINAYLQTLPTFTQDAMFATYGDIHTALKATGVAMIQDENVENLTRMLQPLVSRLFGFVSLDHLTNWVWTQLRPSIPSDIRQSFDSGTMPGSVERTYLLQDYRELIPLALVVRLACPFWFDFSELTKDVVASVKRDSSCFNLIEESWLMHCPAMRRLELFVDHTVGNDRYNDAIMLNGLSSDEFVPWMLASVVVKKLVVVDVMANRTGSAQVVSALFSHVRFRSTGVINGSPKVTAKFAASETSGDSENNLSYLEGFRNRQAVSTGQELANQIYQNRAVLNIRNGVIEKYSLLDRVAPGIDPALVIDALDSASQLTDANIVEEQIHLASWLFHPYTQELAVGSFRKGRIQEMLGLAQAVFLHLNMLDFAVLSTASYTLIPQNTTHAMIGSSVDGPKASEREEFRKHFPLERTGGSGSRGKNIVLDELTAFMNRLQSYNIRVTFSDFTLQRIQGNSRERDYYLPRDMMSLVMKFSQYLATRPIIRRDPDAVYKELTGLDPWPAQPSDF